MASVDDVAAFILDEMGPLDTWKFQKLVYYCQAWHLVWYDEPLFEEPIEAWAGGPVVRHLYNNHRCTYKVATWKVGDPDNLKKRERKTIRRVLEAYGDRSGRELRRLTHSELPWKLARQGLGPNERSSRNIDPLDMSDFYGGLSEDEDAVPVADLPKMGDFED